MARPFPMTPPPNLSRSPIQQGQQAPTRPSSTPAEIARLEALIAAIDFKKANASTVGGLSTAVNALQAGKADVAALDAKADVAALAAKADVAALADKADASALGCVIGWNKLVIQNSLAAVTVLGISVVAGANIANSVQLQQQPATGTRFGVVAVARSDI